MSEDIARQFHLCYERLAPDYGYETREDTKEFDPDTPNGQLMIAVCAVVTGDMQDKLSALESANYEADKILGDGIDELHAKLTALESAADKVVDIWSGINLTEFQEAIDALAELRGVQK